MTESTPPVSLHKVTLSKDKPSVSLSKNTGVIRANLNWDAPVAGPPVKRGLFHRGPAGPQPVDLDLGCLYEFSDGAKGVVQALGGTFTARPAGVSADVIRLDGDDRSGSNTGGENLFIDTRHAEQIKRILIFAYIYEGAADWERANGVVTVYPQSGPQIEVRLGGQGETDKFCAVALLTSEHGVLTLNREVRYIAGSQSDLDRAYGWGIRWVAGRK
jgi:tellurite resistance protein TerA